MTINNLKLYKDVEITTKYGHFFKMRANRE